MFPNKNVRVFGLECQLWEGSEVDEGQDGSVGSRDKRERDECFRIQGHETF